jgi:uncharacterized membrane protein YfcA
VFLAAFFTGILASLGLGGGMVLIIYLNIFTNMTQLQAQGINLVFFLPIAALSLFFHTKNKLVQWKTILPAMLCGSLGAVFGSYIASTIETDVLSKFFGVFILIIGLKEFFSKPLVRAADSRL